LAKRPSSSSTLGTEHGSERGGSGAADRRLLPASQAPAAVRQWGKMMRASREVDSPTYLGRWWRVEAGFPAAADWRWRAWAGGVPGSREEELSLRRCEVRREGLPAPIYRHGEGGNSAELRARGASGNGGGKYPGVDFGRRGSVRHNNVDLTHRVGCCGRGGETVGGGGK
jgi:hypothetical protein